jgi:hypothetical protein
LFFLPARKKNQKSACDSITLCSFCLDAKRTKKVLVIPSRYVLFALTQKEPKKSRLLAKS